LKSELIAQAQYLGLQTCDTQLNGQIPDIIFTSWIQDIDWAYAGLDLACLTSLNEGTPVSLIEAQAGRTPIVSTNVGGIENVVIPNRTALLALNNNTNDFTLKLSEIISNDKMRESMQKEGWDFVNQRFHYNRLVSDMRNLYNELLAEK
jgi:glycosyltransferase involved in cell wall biosynthesis